MIELLKALAVFYISAGISLNVAAFIVQPKEPDETVFEVIFDIIVGLVAWPYFLWDLWRNHHGTTWY